MEQEQNVNISKGVGEPIVGNVVASQNAKFLTRVSFAKQTIVPKRTFADRTKDKGAMFVAQVTEGFEVIDYFGKLKFAHEKADIKLPFEINGRLNSAVQYECKVGEVIAG